MKRIFCFATGNLWKWAKTDNRGPLLNYIRKLDIEGVEITFAEINELNAFRVSKTNMEWLKTLDYVTIHAPFRRPKGMSDTDYIAPVYRLYKKLGAQHIIIHPQDLPEYSVLRKYRMNVSTENMRPYKHISHSDLERILRTYRGMGLCIDVAHAYVHSKDETKKLVERFRDKITQVHLSGTYGKQDHRSLRIVTKRFMESIEPIRQLDVPIVIEESMKKKTIQYIKDEIAYCRSLF